jgi:hypothetical protein
MRGHLIAVGGVVICAACSSSSSPPQSQGGPQGTGTKTSATIGASGGVLTHPDGATLTVPAGALDADAKIIITSTTASPEGFSTWSSPVFAFEPSGLPFKMPATVDLAFTGSPTNPALYWSTASGYVPLPASVDGGKASAPVAALGVGFVAPLQNVGGPPPGGDLCDPYTGSYAGILTFQWSTMTGGACSSTPTNGTGTIAIHFTTTCIGPTVDGTGFLLGISASSTDDAFFGASQLASSQMQMPKNPPTDGFAYLTLDFGNAHLDIGLTSQVTVTSGAAIISSDVGVTKGWSASDPQAYVAAGMPTPCGQVDVATFKINKQ